MRKQIFMAATLLALGVFGVSSASAGANTKAKFVRRDWTVNGVPLAKKESRSFAFTAEAATVITVSGGPEFVCSGWTGTGEVEGNVFGDGKFTSTLENCSVTEQPCPGFKIVMGDAPDKDESDWTAAEEKKAQEEGIVLLPTVQIHGNATAVVAKGCTASGKYKFKGIIDSEWIEGGKLVAPATPLAASSLAVNGKPAVLSGAIQLSLVEEGVLSFSEYGYTA
ncbi:MAG TPA: hypothetical protein VMB51_06580 [Solirubrobacteraceae bacterium]|nr:hypothetical protein [Solirubrobacteraceae bacterium]